MFTEKKSADQQLWDAAQANSAQRLRWALAKKDSQESGESSNALHILSTYTRYGWCGVKSDKTKAEEYLKKAAELGHAQACFDLARRSSDKQAVALDAIDTGLKHVDDKKFDCAVTNHCQASMKSILTGYKRVVEFQQKRKSEENQDNGADDEIQSKMQAQQQNLMSSTH